MAKCLECIHWKPCFNGKDWDAAIGEPCEYFANGVTVQRWIPVTERLPDDNECVLCWGCGFEEIGWYLHGSQRWYTDDFTYDDGDVTHWMPLPEPPKEDAE